MAQEWNKITNGKVRLTFINAVTLGDETGVIKKITSVRPGQKSPLQGGVFSPPGIHSLAPDAGIYTLSVPFLIRSQEELDLVLDKFGGKIKDAIRKAGYEVITWSNVGWLSFYTTSPVNSLADLKKLRIASAGLDNNVLHQAFAACGFRTMSVMSDKLAQSLQSSHGQLGGRLLETELLHHGERALGQLRGQSRAHGQLDFLVVHAERVAAGMRTKDHAAATEVRRTDSALTSTASALLAERLAATAADHAARARVVRALAPGGALSAHHVVHDMHVRLDAEDVGGNLGRAGRVAARVLDVDSRHS